MGIQDFKELLHGKYFKKNRRPEMITDSTYQSIVFPRPSLNIIRTPNISLDSTFIKTNRVSSDSSSLIRKFSAISNYPVFAIPLDDAVRLNSAYNPPLFDNKLCLPELQTHVPIVVLKLIEYITTYGLSEEGIYRVSGSTASIRKLKKKFIDEGPTFELNPEEFDIHTVTSLFKLYLRELPIDIFKVSRCQELRYVPEGYDWPMTPDTITIPDSSDDSSTISPPGTPGISEVPELFPSSPESQKVPESPSLSIRTFESTYLGKVVPKCQPNPTGPALDLVRHELMQLRVSHFALLHVIIRHLSQVAENSIENRMSVSNLVVIFSATLRMHKSLLIELITKGDLTFADIPSSEDIMPESMTMSEDIFVPQLNKVSDDFARRRNRRKSGIRARASSFDFFDPGFFRTRMHTT